MNEILVTMTIELEQEVYDQASELFRSLGTTIEDMAVAFLKFCATSENLPRVNPKFCVNSQRGENRAEFNVCGSGFIRLPPCAQYNAGGDGCQGRRQGRRSSERRVQRRADP